MAYTVAPVPANRCTPLPAPPGLQLHKWYSVTSFLFWKGKGISYTVVLGQNKIIVLKGVYGRFMHETNIRGGEKTVHVVLKGQCHEIFCLWFFS
jgi:hypothetical protein